MSFFLDFFLYYKEISVIHRGMINMGRKKLDKIQQIFLFDGIAQKQEEPVSAVPTGAKEEAAKKVEVPKNHQIVFPKLLGKNNRMNIQGKQVSFDFVHQVESFLLHNEIPLKGKKFLLGVSGGSDSVAMLLAFYYLRNKYDLKLLVSHINYKLRGEESDADCELLRKICFEKNILLEVKEIDGAGQSEKGLRDIRFAEFARIAERDKIKNLCLAHNKNDQVETVLFNIVRGSGVSGAAGIKKCIHLNSNLLLSHPLLNMERKQITEFLTDQNVQWAEDRTNAEPVYSRNKIRLELLPWLRDNLNNNVLNNIFEFSSILNENHLFWQEQVKSKMNRLKNKGESEQGLHCFPISKLKKESPLLRYYLYKEYHEEFTGKPEGFYRQHFNEIEKILKSNGSVSISLFEGKMSVIKEYDNLFFSEHDFTKGDISEESLVLPKISKVFVYNNYRFRLSKAIKIPEEFDRTRFAFLNYEKLEFPLVVRTAVTGDKFTPVGMKGHKKLRDFFVDEKVSKFERKRIPILTDMKGIVWVGGYRVDNRTVADANCGNILKIELEELDKSRTARRRGRRS